MGYLTKDPVLKYGTVDGKPYVMFVLASERDFRPGGKAIIYDFVPFTAFGRMGELVMQYTKKGQVIIVEYAIRTVSYKVGGKTMSQCKPVVERIRFDRLRDPLAEVPKRGEPYSEEYYYEGFDGEGLIDHEYRRKSQVDETGKLKDADGEAQI